MAGFREHYEFPVAISGRSDYESAPHLTEILAEKSLRHFLANFSRPTKFLDFQLAFGIP